MTLQQEPFTATFAPLGGVELYRVNDDGTRDFLGNFIRSRVDEGPPFCFFPRPHYTYTQEEADEIMRQLVRINTITT